MRQRHNLTAGILYKLLVLLVVVSQLLITASKGQDNPNLKHSEVQPQCAQYAVYTCCQILGVPVSMNQVCGLIPPKDTGGSMLQMAKALKRAGLDWSAEKCTYGEMVAGSMPVIAHLITPNENGTKHPHFIVVVSVDKEKLRIIDGMGYRVDIGSDAFLRQWTGNVLRVIRPSKGPRIPKFLARSTKKAPRVQFDTLLIDKGDIPQSQEEVVFEFPYKNIGEADFKIHKIKTDCKCAVADDVEQTIVHPGESGKIVLRYRFTEKEGRGRFGKSALVTCNDPYFPAIRLTIAGDGLQTVQVRPARMNFGRITKTHTGSEKCFLYYTGKNYFEIKAIETDIEDIDVQFRKVTPELMRKIEPSATGITWHECRNRYLITAMIRTTNMGLGELNTDIEVTTNLENNPLIRIPVDIHITPPVIAWPNRLFFGQIKPGETVRETVMLTSDDISFEVIKVDTGETGLNCFPRRKSDYLVQLEFTGKISKRIDSKSLVIVIKVGIDNEDQTLDLVLPIVGLVSRNLIEEGDNKIVRNEPIDDLLIAG